MALEQVGDHQSFGGRTKRYEHSSQVLDCTMRFSLFLPPQAGAGVKVPVIYWLSGLTCTDENAMQKAGTQRLAAELGVAIVAPDTSPRGADVPDDPAYDLGQGAGFYLNATQAPWDNHFRMYDYVLEELPALVEQAFPVTGVRSVMGHSMGGHGALVLALRNPGRFRAVSAFAPISHPVGCPWGEKAFSAYLGKDRAAWAHYDACLLMERLAGKAPSRCVPALVDQGSEDQFLHDQLKPHLLSAVAERSAYPLTLNMRQGYDHSYYFVASFIDDHLHFHARHLQG